MTLQPAPDFKMIAAEILFQLDHAFPLAVTFSSLTLLNQFSEVAEQGLEHVNVINASFHWLSRAGYIHIGNQDLNDFFDVTLSEKTVAIFIESKRHQQPAITQLLAGNIEQKGIAIENLILKGAANVSC